MKILATPLMGRLGNQMFQYAFARAMAEQEGYLLTTPKWVGQEIFEISDPPCPTHPDITLPEHYRQDQDALNTYTRADCRRWFKFRPEWISRIKFSRYPALMHIRRGDYAQLGYPLVALASYEKAAIANGFDFRGDVLLVSEEHPLVCPDTPRCLPDFYRLTDANTLFRSNSSFSWWAATLSRAKIFSPVIDGKLGGEAFCEFVEGNWPKLADLPGITDLHLKEA